MDPKLTEIPVTVLRKWRDRRQGTKIELTRDELLAQFLPDPNNFDVEKGMTIFWLENLLDGLGDLGLVSKDLTGRIYTFEMPSGDVPYQELDRIGEAANQSMAETVERLQAQGAQADALAIEKGLLVAARAAITLALLTEELETRRAEVLARHGGQKP